MTQDDFFICKAEKGGVAVATATDAGAADEKSDKSIWQLLNIRCTSYYPLLFPDKECIYLFCFHFFFLYIKISNGIFPEYGCWISYVLPKLNLRFSEMTKSAFFVFVVFMYYLIVNFPELQEFFIFFKIYKRYTLQFAGDFSSQNSHNRRNR